MDFREFKEIEEKMGASDTQDEDLLKWAGRLVVPLVRKDELLPVTELCPRQEGTPLRLCAFTLPSGSAVFAVIDDQGWLTVGRLPSGEPFRHRLPDFSRHDELRSFVATRQGRWRGAEVDLWLVCERKGVPYAWHVVVTEDQERDLKVQASADGRDETEAWEATPAEGLPESLAACDYGGTSTRDPLEGNSFNLPQESGRRLNSFRHAGKAAVWHWEGGAALEAWIPSASTPQMTLLVPDCDVVQCMALREVGPPDRPSWQVVAAPADPRLVAFKVPGKQTPAWEHRLPEDVKAIALDPGSPDGLIAAFHSGRVVLFHRVGQAKLRSQWNMLWTTIEKRLDSVELGGLLDYAKTSIATSGLELAAPRALLLRIVERLLDDDLSKEARKSAQTSFADLLAQNDAAGEAAVDHLCGKLASENPEARAIVLAAYKGLSWTLQDRIDRSVKQHLSDPGVASQDPEAKGQWDNLSEHANNNWHKLWASRHGNNPDLIRNCALAVWRWSNPFVLSDTTWSPGERRRSRAPLALLHAEGRSWLVTADGNVVRLAEIHDDGRLEPKWNETSLPGHVVVMVPLPSASGDRVLIGGQPARPSSAFKTGNSSKRKIPSSPGSPAGLTADASLQPLQSPRGRRGDFCSHWRLSSHVATVE